METMITASFILAGISGSTIVMDGETEKKIGVATMAGSFIAGAITPIFDFVLGVGFIIWIVALGLTALFQSGDTTKGKGSVGVEMPGAKYPLGGFKKPTIKNMVKM